MKHKVLGIIPARGGSKEVPGKNIRLLAGKPLVAYTIKAALKAKKLDKAIVSTDNKIIARISKEYGAEVPFLRPRSLAKASTPMFPVIEHAVNFLEEKGFKFNIIIVLQPTSPLRTAKDINRAVNKLIRTKADSVVSLCLAEYSPYWMKVIRNNRIAPFIKKKEYSRRQDLPKLYRLNGAIYATKRDVLIKQKRLLGRNTKPLIMKQGESIDIDTELDFKLAELILKEKQ